MEPAVGMTMTQLISNITEIFTAVIGYVGTVATTITSNPLLLIGCIIPVVGIGVGMFKRLLNV